MKNKVFNVFLDVLLILLLALCVYGLVCRINKRPFSLFGYQFYVIQSGSMEPELHKFDLTVVKKVAPETLQAGDIITFRNSLGLVITHRIVTVQDGSFITRGDANTGNDSDPVTFGNVYGVNVGKVRYLGAVFQFFQSGYGITLIVLLLSLFLCKDAVKRLITGKPERSDEPKDQ